MTRLASFELHIFRNCSGALILMGHGSRCACGELRQLTCTFRVISKPVREDKPAAVQKHHTLALININAACTQTSSLCVHCCPGTWTQIFFISFALILMTGRRGPTDASRRHTETSCSQMHDTVDWVLIEARTAQPHLGCAFREAFHRT